MLVEPWLLRAARRRPRHEALRTGDRSLDYATLAAAARRVAGGLPEPGAWVGLAMAPGAEFAIALHACLLRGTPAVPIDPRLGARARELLAARCTVVLDELPDGPSFEVSGHDLEATAIVVHTSGTSGEPKPIELTYGNWLWSALGAHVSMGLRDDERWLCTLPLSHVGGLSILLRSAVYGTTAIVHERFDVDRVLAALRADTTVVSLVPTTLARLLDAGLTSPPALRAALIGGAPIPAALLERAAAAQVPTMETYGLTETCSQITTNGRPLFCARVAVSADGGIMVGGPTVAPAALGDGGWLATGDLCVLDEGILRVTGRKSDTIVTGGENVAPAEVEAVLATHPAVEDVGVHGRDDPEWGEAVVATIVLREGAQATPAELAEHCRARLATYQVPKAFAFAETLPRTPSGKLLRRELA